MTAEQLAHFRQKLLSKLTELFQTVNADLQQSLVERVYRDDSLGDEADDSERDLVQDLRLRLDERAGALAEAIEDALERVRRGAYGRCVDDGRPIELERLELAPAPD